MKRYFDLLDQGRRRTNLTKKIESFKQAIKLYPKRPESYYYLMVHQYYTVLPAASDEPAKLLAKHKAFSYGIAGLPLLRSGDVSAAATSSAFDREILAWRYLMELSVIAYAVERYGLAFQLGEQLQHAQRYPPNEKQRIETNQNYYVDAICVPCAQKSRLAIGKPVTGSDSSAAYAV